MKVVLLGSTQVGKTSMLNRLTSGLFKEDSAATIGAAFQTHVISTNQRCLTMQIWDTAGQERYRALTPMYYRSANVAILCFDLTNVESFKALDIWIQELEEKGPTNMTLVLAGTKLDKVDDRRVSKEEAESYAAKNGLAFYMECSAKSGEGVVELFKKVAEIGEPQAEERPINRGNNNLTNKEEKSGGCC
ncbi:small GTP-binding protein [Tritrichomonas foetus]|uniref:Small GTP-binding protein n=1 Tax=Tritrichomonas foetus TaxID=1144522 RepID=A0A1J4KLR5_9EUKA|nr:small GTP-binding protein [Tritrichomonas foetus]|eukprot:OHT10740.1 small GTP-binding protein [Tritrichomonas foetus]